MNDRGLPVLPPRWLNCPCMGDMILDIFIPFKTPLDQKFDNFIDPEKYFHVDDVFRSAEPYKLGLIIDLTKSYRYYNKREVIDNNCKYIKIDCKGRDERPTQEQVNLFVQVVNQFLDNNSGNKKIGVHCTHGFNRTGFLIVAYMIEELNYGVDIAVQIFTDARPPGIYKADYLEELFTRYGCIEDCIAAPKLPDWCLEGTELDQCSDHKRQAQTCPDALGDADIDEPPPHKISRTDDLVETLSPTKPAYSVRTYPHPPQGTPELMGGIMKVDTLNQDSPEAHDARDLADKLCKLGGFIYTNGQIVPAMDPNNCVNDDENCDVAADELAQANAKHKRPLTFKGSQPVSVTQRNLGAIVSCDYCVSYKADGTRYFLLIVGPNNVYLIDRANFVYKPQALHFPTVCWVRKYQQQQQQQQQPGVMNPNISEFLKDPDGHLTNTLADGEMVLCHDHSKPPNIATNETTGTPRFLIYDLITLNNRPIGRLPFFERYAAIDKQIIWPRNTGGHMGLVDFGVQSFSVRRKLFRPIQQTEELLKSNFLQTLDHSSDGLVFQPCGQDDCYVLGTCPLILKWKPPNLNTIDFRCKVEYERKVGEIPGYVGYLFLGGLNVPSAKLAHVSSRDKNLDGKIVECVFVPGVGWKVTRVRTDKSEPNYHTSGVAIIESIMYPVTVEQVVMCVRQRLNKLNTHQQAISSTTTSSSSSSSAAAAAATTTVAPPNHTVMSTSSSSVYTKLDGNTLIK